jgi:galactokinase/mevalonate kinase-like predicted kinase
MKHASSLLMILAIGISSVFAQQRGGERKDQTPEQQVERLNQAVDLTEIQQEELLLIFTDSKSKADEIRSSLTMDEGEQALKDLRKETYEQVKTVLTEEQLTTLEAKRKEMRGQRRGPR